MMPIPWQVAGSNDSSQQTRIAINNNAHISTRVVKCIVTQKWRPAVSCKYLFWEVIGHPNPHADLDSSGMQLFCATVLPRIMLTSQADLEGPEVTADPIDDM